MQLSLPERVRQLSPWYQGHELTEAEFLTEFIEKESFDYVCAIEAWLGVSVALPQEEATRPKVHPLLAEAIERRYQLAASTERLPRNIEIQLGFTRSAKARREREYLLNRLRHQTQKTRFWRAAAHVHKTFYQEGSRLTNRLN
jgi:hypothetical protein